MSFSIRQAIREDTALRGVNGSQSEDVPTLWVSLPDGKDTLTVNVLRKHSPRSIRQEVVAVLKE